MVIGNTSKGEEVAVSPNKGKHLTNVRAAARLLLAEDSEVVKNRAVVIRGVVF